MLKIALLLVLSGCASLMDPGPDVLWIDSNPQGAKVYVDWKHVGYTPAMIPIQREGEGIIKVEAPGFQPVLLDQDKILNPWVVFNVVFGGVVGVFLDLFEHNQGMYSEAPIFLELQPLRVQH